MGKIAEYIISAVKHILHNRFRSLLTMLGIIIGISSVITVITLGDGMQDFIVREFNSLGGNYAYLEMDMAKTSNLITLEDMKLLENSIPELYGVSMRTVYMGDISSHRVSVDTQITGGTQYLIGMYAQGIEKGRYISERDIDTGAPVCVIQKNDAEKLFGTTDVLGNTVEVTIGNITEELTVIGVREDLGGIMNMVKSIAMEDYLAMIEVPYTLMSETYQVDMSGFSNICLFSDLADMKMVRQKAERILENKYDLRGTRAVFSETMGDYMGELEAIMTGVKLFVALVAAISLLVGGIGVMNIMLVSVTERTREIGIRKSIGARTSSILIQFLAESAILSAIGGVIGIIVGIVAALALCNALGMKADIRPEAVIIATLFSAGVGVFFGIYPARRAAKMKPIDALKL